VAHIQTLMCAGGAEQTFSSWALRWRDVPGSSTIGRQMKRLRPTSWLQAAGGHRLLRPAQAWLVLPVLLLVAPPAQAQLGGFVSPGDLAEAHAELEGLTRCTKCHEAGAGVSAERCLDCHEEVQTQVRTRRGYHADLDELCERCHSDHKGRGFDMVQLDPERFRHQSTGFALAGAHEIECEKCHKEEDTWTGLSRACDSCHGEGEPHGAAASERPLLTDCRACHHDRDWSALPLPPSIFDHLDGGFVDYILDGAHRDADCVTCHLDWLFVPTGAEACTDCHEDPHRVRFGQPCEDCHAIVKGWDVPRFDHDRTPYPLRGRHRHASCVDCHEGDVTRALAHEFCEDCHDDVHEGQFAPQGCVDCHSLDVAGFALPDFDHSTTRYPLEGLHIQVPCDKCHENEAAGQYVGLPFELCSDCHTDVHDGAFDPRGCEACHSVEVESFGLSGFDHRRSDYPLDANHDEIGCKECHGEGEARVWTGLPFADCDDCHADPHEARFEPTDCVTCHAGEGWSVQDFDHGLTDYPLQGAHAAVECTKCHGEPEPVYRDLPHASCLDCHASTNPHLPELGPETCDACHLLDSWQSIAFDHGTTRFALGAPHIELPCDACHGGAVVPKAWVFTGLDPEGTCTDCHADRRPPLHYTGDCAPCHRSTDWVPADFGDHGHAITGWPLRGVHTRLDCAECHAEDRPWGLAASSCGDCHITDDPHEGQLGWGACSDCHGETDWYRTRFRHEAVGWRLRGSHRLASCVDCHATGYAGTPVGCWRCHEAEASPFEPAHDSAYFTACDVCHNSYDWAVPGFAH
jgi:hypothetical protein